MLIFIICVVNYLCISHIYAGKFIQVLVMTIIFKPQQYSVEIFTKCYKVVYTYSPDLTEPFITRSHKKRHVCQVTYNPLCIIAVSYTHLFTVCCYI